MSDLDDLMSLDPLSLSDQDIDKIIERQRKHRGLVEKGVKVKKDKGPEITGALEGLMVKMTGSFAPSGPKVSRR